MPLPKCKYNAVSAIADEIWQYRAGGNPTIFDKDHDTAEEGRLQRFLQSSVRLRYNCYVQLVATKRGRMHVPNLKFWSPRTELYLFESA